MDFQPFILPIALLLTITFLLLKKSLPNTQTTQTTKITLPEPPGALPIIGHLHLLGGPAPVARTLGAMADAYGPTFTLQLGAHRALVVSSWQSIKECFTTNDRAFATRPNMATGKYLGYENASFALSPYGPYWRHIRKMATLELLTPRRLDGLAHIRASEIGLFVKHLYYSIANDVPNKAIALSTWVEHLTFNIIIGKLAGKRYPYARDEDKDYRFKEAIKKALHLSGVFVLSDAIPCLEWLDIGGYIKEMKDTSKVIDDVLEDWVRERAENRGGNDDAGDFEGSDFLDAMFSAIPENETVHGYTRSTVIKATMMILIMTGSESTAETLIWALSLLLNSPRVLREAQREMDSTVGRARWAQESDIKDLPYLQSVVKETLRLYPPGPLSGPREAAHDCWVGGAHVPRGTRLVVNLWKMLRDPEVWSGPDEFRPERFVEEQHRDTNFKGQCFEYIPFSSGRRMCPGMGFGMRVVQLALARLVQGFDLSTADGESVDMGEGLGLALPKLKPLEVVLEPRLGKEMLEMLNGPWPDGPIRLVQKKTGLGPFISSPFKSGLFRLGPFSPLGLARCDESHSTSAGERASPRRHHAPRGLAFLHPSNSLVLMVAKEFRNVLKE
ncbi:cytochrome P450 [Striga asiatica]|uniref:Flavonoid-6-hydroxylase n=1 Tax=Striga asiatica TaxID=4170 RepID=A0A5A7RJK6_STRAF|nr:cytochrome P450 [Striga asiatica]